MADEAPDLAAEIGRRLVQLDSCRALVAAGYVVDPGAVFLDDPPADAAKTKAALEQIRAGLKVDPGWNGNTDDLRRITAALAGLTVPNLRRPSQLSKTRNCVIGTRRSHRKTVGTATAGSIGMPASRSPICSSPGSVRRTC